MTTHTSKASAPTRTPNIITAAFTFLRESFNAICLIFKHSCNLKENDIEETEFQHYHTGVLETFQQVLS
jgi:hypothetical protein